MTHNDLLHLADDVAKDLGTGEDLLMQSANLSGDALQQAIDEVDALIHGAVTQLRRGFREIDAKLDFDLVDGTYERKIEFLWTVLEKLDELIDAAGDGKSA